LTAALALGARVVLASTFVFSAIAKLRSPEATRAHTVALLGASMGPLVAVWLPMVELALAIALLVWWSPVPGVVAAVVLLAFTGLLVRAQTSHLPCPCFGSGTRAVGSGAMFRNAALVACAVVATGSPAKTFAVALVGVAISGA
jgi:hypothetical protein